MDRKFTFSFTRGQTVAWVANVMLSFIGICCVEFAVRNCWAITGPHPFVGSLILAIGVNFLASRVSESSADGDDGDGDPPPYNYDPDDPQDWWKKEGGKAFK